MTGGLAVVAPGQGGLRPGSLERWSTVPAVARLLDAGSDRAGTDLSRVGAVRSHGSGQGAPTSLVQPALVALASGAWLALHAASRSACLLPPAPSLLAGHSVGELSVAAVGGAIEAEAATTLAYVRGRAMAACASERPTAMLAVTTLARAGTSAATARTVQDEIISLAAPLGVVAAVRNGSTQVVLAGPADAVEQTRISLAASPARGVAVRATPLAVDGAFHTSAMDPAVPLLQRALATTRTPARCPGGPAYVSGLDGALVDGATLLSRLPRGIVEPVRWDLVMRTLDAQEVTGVLELPPAGTLSGLLRREAPHIAVLALHDPADLDAVTAFAADHVAGPG